MKPRAVFLDAGNTLFRPTPSVGSVYARVARRHGARVPAAEVQRRFESAWTKHNTTPGLGIKDARNEKAWWRRLVADVFHGDFPDATRFDVYFEELYREFASPRTWKLYPDALPTLAALRRRGFIVGIVSNWDERLFEVCEGLGVTPLTDFILASEVEGTSKPDKLIFKRALKKAGVRAAEALHAGDSYREDYLGALESGLQARLLCRKGTPPDGAAVITSLKPLAAL